MGRRAALGSVAMGGMRCVFLLLLAVLFLPLLPNQVTMATGKTSCNPGEYEVLGNLSCSRVCPAGYYVSRPIDQDHPIGACSQCTSGTFRAHPSEESRCTPCAQCREDQEVVKRCSATSDQECQCQPGKFYCDSVDCTESCLRCTRCEDGAILQPCNATSNTICALNPQSGKGPLPSLKSVQAKGGGSEGRKVSV
ncbi:tumor necrosis factor receptor superfamily member 26-like, partial [Oryx dammah]|uniref:tumor necrosis factor receptor superfamily member 26-like n=1 Tax=Oryx dammah TaxID=59534 RepID=UPI001A9AA380